MRSPRSVKPARDRLAQLLAGTQPASADSAELRLPREILTLKVDEAGPVELPVRAAQAKKLIAAARPAHFGRGESTVKDTSVRDTWELEPAQVTLGGAQWQAELEAALAYVRDELGLPRTAHLTAELHSALVYGKGQFFLPHQDSEKHEDMVATLVVMLPSVHTGGELIVDDGGTEKTYTGSRDEIVFVAFYADRRHEVRPVKSGYRVSLTFNLLLTASVHDPDSQPVEEAASYLTEHFATSAISRYGSRELGVPLRLAFLLDHEYTELGLAANRLKGADAKRVADLRAAAAQAGCEAVLALAEVKETWDVAPRDRGWRGYGGYAGDDGTDTADLELNDLLDDEITLGWWMKPDGSGGEKINFHLRPHEVCAATPSASLTPYASEYEGYMGNYGNTVDRWYRRAVVVIWPKDRAFAARAEAGSAWAMDALLAMIGAGDLDGARAAAASLAPFWKGVGADLLMPALRVAAGLEDEASATVVSAPFTLELLTAEHASLLAALAAAYGEAWCMNLIDTWNVTRPYQDSRTSWIEASLESLVLALREAGAPDLAEHIAALAWEWLWSRLDAEIKDPHFSRRRTALAELAPALARLVEVAVDELGTRIVAALRASDEPATDVMVAALRCSQVGVPEVTAAVAGSGSAAPVVSVAALAADAEARLTRRLTLLVRDDTDWSIVWAGCGCDLCARLAEFLESRTEQTLEWPLAERGRQHVQQQIDGADLPVQCSTKRQGRPYTLLLSKTDELFRRDKDMRKQAERDLAWVRATFG